MKFYVDTCIWLNVLKREKRSFNSSFNFLTSDKPIVISPIIFKELYWKLKSQFHLAKEFIDNCGVEIIHLTKNDYNFARSLERKYGQTISFIDFLNIAICKNKNFILVSRDRELIKIAKKYIKTLNP